jgi:CheY-like chemotaxis protein
MSAQPPQAPRRLLCVDDDRDTCEMLTILLGQCGYQVVATTSVREALDLAKQSGFDLISLDSWFSGRKRR